MNYSKLYIALLGVTVISSSFIFDLNQNQESPESILAGGQAKSWRLTKETFNGNDITAMRYKDCDLDNAYTFYADTRFVEIEGVSKCSPNNSDTIRVGNWKLTNDKTMLVIQSNIDTLTFHIDTLTSANATGTIQTTQGAFQSTFVAY